MLKLNFFFFKYLYKVNTSNWRSAAALKSEINEDSGLYQYERFFNLSLGVTATLSFATFYG